MAKESALPRLKSLLFRKTFKKIVTVSILFIALLTNHGLFANSIPSLTIDDTFRQLTKEILTFIQKHHYQPRQLNDDFAENVYDNFLNTIDYQRIYLAEADLANYTHMNKTLDEDLSQGNMDDMEALYKLMQNRRLQAIEYFIVWLENTDNQFNFTRDESIQLDAKKRPRAKDLAGLKDLWRKLLKNDFINGFLAEENEAQIRQRLLKRYRNQIKLLTQVKNSDMYNTIINSITSITGPHTNYLSPRNVEDFNIDMSLSLQGIGAILTTDTDYTQVQSIVIGGPADKVGELKASDYIVGVAQEDGTMIDVVGWRLDDVVDLIRGPKGTQLRLQIVPEGNLQKPSKDIQIIRDRVKLEDQAATKHIIELESDLSSSKTGTLKIGIIKLSAFYVDFAAYKRGDKDYRSTTRDVLKLVNELVAAKIDGLVIDLRNNGGGSLAEARQLTSLFIDIGPIVQVRYNNGQINVHRDPQYGVEYSGPMAVLVNRASASASEIFAGAMQDYQRALIIGSQTYGKGTVQNLKDISLGQIKYTQSKFYRVTGESTQHRGVIPDLELPSLMNPEKIGESNLDFAMPWDQVAALNHQRYFNFPSFVPYLREQQNNRMASDPDLRYVQQVKDFRAKEQDLLSLNIEARKALSVTNQQWFLEAINDLRTQKGLEPVDDTDDHQFKFNEVATDPYIRASGKAIVDWIELASRTAN